MRLIASPITSLTIVYSTVYSRRRSKKTSKLRVTGLCAGNSPATPHKGPVPRKMFPIDDGIMDQNELSAQWRRIMPKAKDSAKWDLPQWRHSRRKGIIYNGNILDTSHERCIWVCCISICCGYIIKFLCLHIYLYVYVRKFVMVASLARE